MTALLEDRSSPLFHRLTHRLHLGHWDFSTLFEVFDWHGVTTPEHRLFLWSLFEGVPKFYRDAFEQAVLATAPGFRERTLERLFFEGASPLKDEAATWFLRELRGSTETILRIIARSGPCALSVIREEYARDGGGDKELGGYLKALTERYQLVDRQEPVLASRRGRKGRYAVSDNFLAAWLGAIGRSVQRARVQPTAAAVARASSLLAEHEGLCFERMARQLTQECSRLGVGDFGLTELVRGYWNRAEQADIELDIVALNEDDRAVRFGSSKRSDAQHTGSALARFGTHVDRFLATKEGRRLAGWRQERALYAPSFDPARRIELESRGWICRELSDFERWLTPRPAAGGPA